MKSICTLFLILSFSLHAQQRPNVILIISDDHAYQAISAYGAKIAKTPNIDRIANEGIRFDGGYVTNSLCGPSRATILTGKYSHKNGFYTNTNSSFDFDQETFISDLTSSGYQTAWIGKMHLGNDHPKGFSYYNILDAQGWYFNSTFVSKEDGSHVEGGYVANVIEDDAERWLDGRDKSKPFFLVIGHKNTHRVWVPDFQDMGAFDKVNFPIPKTFYDDYKTREPAKIQEMSIADNLLMGYDLKMWKTKEEEDRDLTVKRMTPEQRKKFDAYYEPIRKDFFSKNLTGKALAEWKYQRYMKDYLSTAVSLDRNIGRTLDYLQQNHLDKNTIVIYMSDQGFYLGEHGWFDKRWMYEESFRTPMVMKWPGVIKPGTVSKDFVLNLDLAPTFLDIAQVPIPKDIQGKSLVPLLKGNGFERDGIFYHFYEGGEHNVSPQFGIKTKRYKLIRYYDKLDRWELFDLQNDPDELNNLYDQKGTESITKDLKQKLRALIVQYDDQEALLVFDTPMKKGKAYLDSVRALVK